MANWNNNTTNSFSWAGQSAQQDPYYARQWKGSNASAQPVGPADLLRTDAPRNNQSLIREFNAELPQLDPYNVGFGQSSWAPAEDKDLPFDLAINNDIDFDAAKPATCDLARTNSQASSTGMDEEGSMVFSISGDLYGAGLHDDGFDSLHSPAATSFSDVLLPTTASVDNSPVAPRCPFFKMETNSGLLGIAPGISPSTPQPSVINVDDDVSNMGFTTASTPRRASGHPTPELFEQWTPQIADHATEVLNGSMWNDSQTSDDFTPYTQSQLGPSFVIDPPEITDVPRGDLDEYTSPGVFTPFETHPDDYLSNYPPSQSTGPHSVPSMPMLPTATMTAPNRLLVPNRRRRRTSDPARLSGFGSFTPRGTLSQHRSPRIPSSSNSPLVFQRLRPSEPLISSGATAPMSILSSPRRLSATGRSSDSHSPVRRPNQTGPARGRRQGPMDPVSRGQAKETRNKKMVCIRCKLSKQKCKRSDDSIDGSCIGCDRHGGSLRWPGPCVRAHFEDIILSGTCNYISQRFINHSTLDGTTRIRKTLPKEICIENMMTRLDRIRDQFNIRVHQDGQPVYLLDLDACHGYLMNLKQQMDGTKHSWRAFIDKEVLRTDARNDDWERCMTQVTTARGDLLALLCTVNNMPSRASFSYVWKRHYTAEGAPMEQLINVEEPAETDSLLLAAQLSRIICRKLEVKAYGHLQRMLHESGSMNDNDVLPFLQMLGRILLTLRWRLSWWAMVPGDPAMDDGDEHADQLQFELRVQSLCRVLYFYYCCVRRRLAVWTNFEALRGILSTYPDTQVDVWDDFPGAESVEEFELWMSRGQELIVQAGVLARLASMGLSS
ncbi:hypothetical protein EsH8_VI_000264 [Colletotrichum jinshuiense]